MWAAAPSSSHRLRFLTCLRRRYCSARGSVVGLAAWEGLALKRDGEKRGREPKLLKYPVPARVNESTPAAHVLSVCAYFPNLDMGSEPLAPRACMKLAGPSPFRSPHLAAARCGDAPRCWDRRLQIASCPKPTPPWGWRGPKVPWHSSPALAPLLALVGST